MQSVNELIEKSLNRRYATKVFDSAKKVSDHDFATLQNALRLAPSSYGIQPWKFVWVQDAAKRVEIRAAAYNQAQAVDADRLLFIAVKTDLKAAIQSFVDGMIGATGKSAVDFAQYKSMMEGSAERGGMAWAQRQLYIPLGFALQTAAMLGLDACPMEGFDPDAINKILGLSEKGLSATVMLTIGYGVDGASPNQHAKFRFPAESVNLTI